MRYRASPRRTHVPPCVSASRSIDARSFAARGTSGQRWYACMWDTGSGREIEASPGRPGGARDVGVLHGKGAAGRRPRSMHARTPPSLSFPLRRGRRRSNDRWTSCIIGWMMIYRGRVGAMHHGRDSIGSVVGPRTYSSIPRRLARCTFLS